MAARDSSLDRHPAADARHGALWAAVDVIRDGETVLSLIDPAARGRDPVAFSAWLQARFTIAELPRLMHPGCDERCEGVEHSPDRMVVLSDIALDPTGPRPSTWWTAWNESLEKRHQAGAIWFAGAPAMPLTPPSRRLAAGTRVRRIATTDPHLVAYDGVGQETLFSIEDGDLAGDALVTVSFGHAPLLPSLAGTLVAPDHPPVLDPPVAFRLLAAGWAAVARGLPHED